MEKTRVAYNLMCDDDCVIYISTSATSLADCASAIANADCDCSAGDDWGVADGDGDDTVNVRL